MSKLTLLKEGDASTSSFSKKELFEIATRVKCDRFWHQHSVIVSAQEKERERRTTALLKELIPQQRCLDIGCGRGEYSLFLESVGMNVYAVDASTKAPFEKKRLGILPYLKLEDDSFDVVLCLDVIAEIDPHLHRLSMSEMARVLSRNGKTLISTPLDLHSEDALEQFLALVETEFEIEKASYSYHSLHFYISRFLGAPGRFVKAALNPEYLQKQLEQREKLPRAWFALNSNRFIKPWWRLISIVSNPIFHKLQKSRGFLLFLESIGKKLNKKRSLTHVILVCRKKRLF